VLLVALVFLKGFCLVLVLLAFCLVLALLAFWLAP
jgi:hypothetical protein